MIPQNKLTRKYITVGCKPQMHRSGLAGRSLVRLPVNVAMEDHDMVNERALGSVKLVQSTDPDV